MLCKKKFSREIHVPINESYRTWVRRTYELRPKQRITKVRSAGVRGCAAMVNWGCGDGKGYYWGVAGDKKRQIAWVRGAPKRFAIEEFIILDKIEQEF